MALSLSNAKSLSRRKSTGKIISEYVEKASPAKKQSFNGATGRFRPAKKKK